VTEDSTNMLTEAAATGKPLLRLPMAGTPGKFQALYDKLETLCGVRRWSGIDALPAAYAPLRETQRIAARVVARMGRA
ncbi:MAG: ELM1/GtrOC1 family putative glycosyltransferase, partial [Litorimonas sp.]